MTPRLTHHSSSERSTFQFHGIDKRFNTSLDNRHINSATVRIGTHTSNSQEFIYNTLVKRVKVALEDNRHVLRARQMLNDLDYYYYSDEPPQELARKIVRKSNRALSHCEMSTRLVESGMSANIWVHSHAFFLATSHLFIDGMRILEILGLCLDGPICDYTVVPRFDYVPLITEASTILELYSMCRPLSFCKFSYDCPAEKVPPRMYYFSDRLCHLKIIKAYLNTRYDRFSFSATLATIAAIYTLDRTVKQEFNLAILTAFVDDSHFNRFSSIIIRVKRAVHWEHLRQMERLHAVSCQIDTALRSYGKSAAILQYMIGNIYDYRMNITDLVDVCVSISPTPLKWLFSGKTARISHMTLGTSHTPLYMGFVTENKSLRTFVNNRSKDISIPKCDILPIAQLAHEIRCLQSDTKSEHILWKCLADIRPSWTD
jgi:hypothetical protein